MIKVSELIEKLKDMPQDAVVVIADADTGWDLHVQEVYVGTQSNLQVVTIGGDYDERFN